MATRERTYRCVGGPCDGQLHTVLEDGRICLSPQPDAAAMSPPDRAPAPSGEASADYDVRRLLASDGTWHEFLTDAKKQGAVIGYGQFLTVALNFIIVAWVLFLVIRAMNRLKRQEDAKVDVPQAPEIPADVKLLSEIRDLLATGQGTGRADIKPVRGS